MQIPELKESKKDFQLERMILFTDAVFAIAITLLIIEIKPPEIHHGESVVSQWIGLAKLIPKFIGFMVSFFVISIYWRSHHRIFGYLHNYDDKLITLNFLFLFFIVLLPFSSAYSSEFYAEFVSSIIYYCNLIAVGLMNFFLLKHIYKSKKDISTLKNSKLLFEFYKARSIAVPCIFFICMLIEIFFKGLGRPILILIWPIMAYISKRYRKKQLKQTV